MSVSTYLAFVAATVVLIALPGPNVALIVANAVAHGRRYGLLTVIGTSAAMIPQLALVAFGMAGALATAGHLLEWLRWLGVGYLIYLGVRAWRAPAVDLTRVPPEPRSPGSIVVRGLLVSLSNPKTLLFYGAFFPQFATSGPGLINDLLFMCATFLVLATGLDCGWALAADRLRPLLATRGTIRNRLTGGCYLAAASGLALARVK